MGKIKNFFKKLPAKMSWAVFTGIAQTVVRFFAEYIGLPGSIVMAALFGGAAIVNFLTTIPSEWVWFLTVLFGLFLIPQTIKASAELRRESAELIKAASRKQKLDQAEKGLRGPVADAKKQNRVSGLNALVNEGRGILVRANEAVTDDEFNYIVDVEYENWATSSRMFLTENYSEAKADKWHGLSPFDAQDWGKGDAYRNRRLTEISLHVKKLDKILEDEGV